MANTFKLKTKLGTGGIAANAVQDVYTVPATTTSIIIGLTIANLTSNSVTVDVKIERVSLYDVSIGLNLPIKKSEGAAGYFDSSSTTSDAVKNNIKNLLLVKY